ncbi:MAG: ComEC/Rec2 family competence protein, partial [Pseudomonadota bacterium]
MAREADRWFLWAPVLFAFGIAAYFAAPVEPPTLLVAAVVLGAVLLKLIWRDGLIRPLLAAMLVIAALGFAAAKVRSLSVDAPVLTHELRNVRITGDVTRVERFPTRGARITLDVVSIGDLPEDMRPRRARIRLLSLKPDDPTPGLGARVRLRATLAPPSRPAYPGGYDFARAAYFMQLGAVGFALDKPETVPNRGAPSIGERVAIAIRQLRAEIGLRIAKALPGEPGAVANALITGDRSGITEATLEAYRDAGIVHILSISG